MSTVEQIAAQHFRTWNSPRRHVPRIWWDGHTWNMSVRDIHNNHHTRCVGSFTEALLSASAWAHLNAIHGLLPNSDPHERAA